MRTPWFSVKMNIKSIVFVCLFLIFVFGVISRAEDVVFDDAALRKIIRSIVVLPPDAEKRGIPFSFVDKRRRLYSRDPISRAMESLKKTVVQAPDGFYKREEDYPPTKLYHYVIETPSATYYVGKSGKWFAEVAPEALYEEGKMPKLLEELLSYVAVIKEHPDSEYRFVKETEDVWVIEEIPSKAFREKVAKFIPKFAKVGNLAPELIEDPHLALIRIAIDKKTHFVRLIEVYGESGYMWYYHVMEKFQMDIPIDEKTFQLPEGCEKVGTGDEAIQKMVQIEMKYQSELRKEQKVKERKEK